MVAGPMGGMGQGEGGGGKNTSSFKKKLIKICEGRAFASVLPQGPTMILGGPAQWLLVVWFSAVKENQVIFFHSYQCMQGLYLCGQHCFVLVDWCLPAFFDFRCNREGRFVCRKFFGLLKLFQHCSPSHHSRKAGNKTSCLKPFSNSKKHRSNFPTALCYLSF